MRIDGTAFTHWRLGIIGFWTLAVRSWRPLGAGCMAGEAGILELVVWFIPCLWELRLSPNADSPNCLHTACPSVQYKTGQGWITLKHQSLKQPSTKSIQPPLLYALLCHHNHVDKANVIRFVRRHLETEREMDSRKNKT